jgi:dTDP-4-dehydrorhamnose reductase
MMTKKILVTGANGQVGLALQELAKKRADYQFLFAKRQDLDITQTDQVNTYFKEYQPAICINCAAYTAVDQAEREPDAAYLLNDQAVGFLAKACQQYQSHFLHLSSDYVYHNEINRPLRESDPCRPQSVYASSKLAGEERALTENPHTHILRTSWVYSPWRHNFVKTMIRLGQEREQLNIVYDQVGAPTAARDIAATLLALTEQPATPPGVYNFANAGVCSWYDFAKAIFELRGLLCQVKPIPGTDYPTPASRPHYSLLDTSKIRRALALEIPHWRESLIECLKEM